MNRLLALFALLITVYSFTYSGTFVTDIEHNTAARSLGLAFEGAANNVRVYGNDRIRAWESLGAPEQAAQATNIEPVQIWLGALLARTSAALGLGRVQTMFLLSIWATALTAVLVAGAVRLQPHSWRIAIVTGLLFGIGAQAWPYARAYFRDTLAMMFTTLAWLGAALVLRTRTPAGHSNFAARWYGWPGWALTLFGLLAGILTKLTVLPAAFVLVAALLMREFLRVRRKLLLAAVVSGALAVVVGILLLPRADALARFSLPYFSFLASYFFTRPHPALLPAFWGPLVSPGKSVFLFSPLLLLSLFAFTRKSRWLFVTGWAYLLLLILAQALFYDANWWGGVNWGLRFVLPALPPLVIATAPLFASLISNPAGKRLLLALAFVSALVQLGGVLAPTLPYYSFLAQAELDGVWDLGSAAVGWAWRWLLAGNPPDLAAVRLPLPGLILAVLLSAIAGLALLGLRRASSKWVAATAALFALLASATLPFIYARDPALAGDRADFQGALRALESDLANNDVVVVKSYGAQVWHFWMNRAGENQVWYSLPFSYPTAAAFAEFRAAGDPGTALDQATLSLMDALLSSRTKRIWLVVPDEVPGASLDLESRWLADRAAASEAWRFGRPNAGTRLFRYTIVPHR